MLYPSELPGLRGPEPRVNCGGAGGDRTHDLLIANETLSQLSYGPTEGSVFYHPIEN